MLVVETFRVLEGKRKEVEAARQDREYTMENAPFREASKFLMAQHARENNWGENDQRWYNELEYYFVPLVNVSKDDRTKINSERARLFNLIKIKLFQNQQKRKISFYKTIEDLIEDRKIYFTGISYRTWNSFVRGLFINQLAFIAYCHVLGLTNWQELAESRKDIIYSNLVKNYNNFIARETEVTKLLNLIDNPYIPIISITALPGFGKTTLVKEAALRFLQARKSNHSLDLPMFDAFIFTSIKQQQHCESRESNLENVYKDIALTLEIKKKIINESNQEQLLKKIIAKFKNINTLLIIDNVETEADKQDIKSLIEQMPSNVKILITSRRRTKLGHPLHLEILSAEDTRIFITEKAQELSVNLTPNQYQQIKDIIGGIPGLIIDALNQLQHDNCLSKLPNKEEFLLKSLKEESASAYDLLMALVMFPKPALRDAIAYVALTVTDDDKINKDLQLLEDRLLIKYDENRYEIPLPLIRNYVSTELTNNPVFEQQARERWINWYLEFSQGYRKKDHKDWYEYEYMDYFVAEYDNLQTAIAWCQEHEKFLESLTFWRNIRPSAYHQGSGANSLFNRLEWTDWLIEASEQNPDYSSHLFELFHDQAWTLTLMENFIKAKKYFRKAWKLRQYHDIQEIELAINIVYFYWKQKKYNKAALWLKLSKELLNKSVDINPENIDRQGLKIWHYEGRIYYERGDQHDLDKAEKCFQKAANLAENINSKRAIYFNQKWVADLYIKANKNLDAAEKLLTECLSMSDENLDKSLIAHCKASMANLKKANYDFVDAKKFAELAYQDFDKLGMLVDKENMELFIQSLER